MNIAPTLKSSLDPLCLADKCQFQFKKPTQISFSQHQKEQLIVHNDCVSPLSSHTETEQHTLHDELTSFVNEFLKYKTEHPHTMKNLSNNSFKHPNSAIRTIRDMNRENEQALHKNDRDSSSDSENVSNSYDESSVGSNEIEYSKHTEEYDDFEHMFSSLTLDEESDDNIDDDIDDDHENDEEDGCELED